MGALGNLATALALAGTKAVSSLGGRTAATARANKAIMQRTAETMPAMARLPKHIMAPFLAVTTGLLNALNPAANAPAPAAPELSTSAPLSQPTPDGTKTAGKKPASAPKAQYIPKGPVAEKQKQ